MDANAIICPPVRQLESCPDFAKNAVNLASSGLGARAVFVTDEFFAPLARMLDDQPPRFIPDKYDDNGKWMDGWESRRKRSLGNDYAIIKLAAIGKLNGVDIDTSHFIGNYPAACKIEACLSDQDMPQDQAEWITLVPMMKLRAGIGEAAHHFIELQDQRCFSHIRLNIYPDGGIARLRVFGQPSLDYGDQSLDDKRPNLINLSASLNGARIIGFSDAHFGDYTRLLAPGRGNDMGDGWETARRRRPGNEWIIIALAAKGSITEILLDTAFFKGNFPDRFSIEAADLSDYDPDLNDAIITSALFWKPLMDQHPLKADHIHHFSAVDHDLGAVTHIRLNIHPDGGVSRLKCYGTLVK